MEFRPASVADVAAIARLHAASWQTAYRGILSDAFLDGPVLDDRLAVWHSRLSAAPHARQFVLLAEQGGELVGFVCVFLDADPKWGAFLDNLHVRPDRQGQGLGRRLMAEAAGWVRQEQPAMGLYLLVFEKNTRARAFYEQIGGQKVEELSYHTVDGTELLIVRYAWDDLDRLIGRCQAQRE